MKRLCKLSSQKKERERNLFQLMNKKQRTKKTGQKMIKNNKQKKEEWDNNNPYRILFRKDTEIIEKNKEERRIRDRKVGGGGINTTTLGAIKRTDTPNKEEVLPKGTRSQKRKSQDRGAGNATPGKKTSQGVQQQKWCFQFGQGPIIMGTTKNKRLDRTSRDCHSTSQLQTSTPIQSEKKDVERPEKHCIGRTREQSKETSKNNRNCI